MGKVPVCVKQIERALPIWERVRIRVIGIWTVAVGECNQVIHYLLGFESEADRTQKWAAFAKDPEWPDQAKLMEAEGPSCCQRAIVSCFRQPYLHCNSVRAPALRGGILLK